MPLIANGLFERIGTNGHENVFASANGKQQKQVRQLQSPGTVYRSYPILPFGIVASTFFRQPFSKQLYAKGTRVVPDKQKEPVKELVVDNSTNNSSSNISKISAFGKGKYCFHGSKDRQVEHYCPNEKTVTLSTGTSQKEFRRVQRNQRSFF